LLAVAVVWLMAGLRPDAFYCGDSGVKLIAARNAIRHPERPLAVDLPRVGSRAVAGALDPFFVAHGDHAHAVQSPLFPVLSAPLLSLFGLRGLYVLPALSFVAWLPLIAVLRRQLAPEASPVMAGVVAALASPLFFYGLEFWEHAPAATALGISTALAFATCWPRAALWAAGAVGGLAMLLRPEAAWYVVALAGVVVADRRRLDHLVWLAAGLTLVLGLWVLYNVWHFGTLTGPHVGANLSALGTDWIAMRGRLVGTWLVPASAAGRLALAAIAVAWIGWFASRRSRWWSSVALAAGIVLATLAAVGGALNQESVWQACPAACLACVPVVGRSRGAWRLLVLAGVSIGGVLLTANNDGGAQWGPRYLLIASPAVMLLAARSATSILESRRLVSSVLVVAILAGAAFVSRRAYAELRGTKRYYGRIVDTMREQAAPGVYVVSDLWWFDQVTASLYGRNTTLYVRPDANGAAVFDDLRRAGVHRVVVARGQAESAPGRFWEMAGCTVEDRAAIKERQMEFLVVGCR
jgi:hypothetical protein